MRYAKGVKSFAILAAAAAAIELGSVGQAVSAQGRSPTLDQPKKATWLGATPSDAAPQAKRPRGAYRGALAGQPADGGQVAVVVCGDPASGDCCDPAGNGTPYCDDAACCSAVCFTEPSCCDVVWDSACAAAANADVVNCPACPPPPCLDTICQDGMGMGGDGNFCTVGVCDPANPDADPFGCIHNPAAPCSPLDACNDRMCDPTGPVEPNCAIVLPKPDGTPCDDGDACTDPDTCTAGVCGGICNPQPYGDIWPRSKGGDGLAEVTDVLCVLAANNGNPDDGPSSPNTAPLGDCGTLADNDMFPCPPGNDGLNEVGDLNAVLAAADGSPPCPATCVCP